MKNNTSKKIEERFVAQIQ